uniref:Uncharacterized protein n=1 Tax=Chromera velia CCMP2878 TaxID=1169474 RepID=A0A0G4FFR6_9ALVE|eukprot:Cvel_16738.t1-p1 / transcript=Cvel_16738.t1 / gene=Cvel_16738 / organism=Chromera_velia_CCMP2878 / gene_product=hypothetical protein / transcript_product=hypothetical protein / location=Cvel_scaffold1302:23835-27174(-) / protein_length=223 / sequence_SO=supercontig / SO=protein_coding / is_pseudo=false
MGKKRVFLHFRSWWMEGAKTRRCVDLKYCINDRSCQVLLEGDPNLYVIPVLHTKRQQPAEWYDLVLGAQLDVMGRKCTLQKAQDVATAAFVEERATALLNLKSLLIEELQKYECRGFPALSLTPQLATGLQGVHLRRVIEQIKVSECTEIPPNLLETGFLESQPSPSQHLLENKANSSGTLQRSPKDSGPLLGTPYEGTAKPETLKPASETVDAGGNAVATES